jgi:phosphinothricin acetyltransferase
MIGWVSFSSFHERAAYNGTVEVSIYLDETCRGKDMAKRSFSIVSIMPVNLR